MSSTIARECGGIAYPHRAGSFARLDSSVHQGVGELFELGARELDVEVLRTRGVRGDEGQVDLGRA
eukprot:6882224-Prymnesium_polylepis.2